MAEVPDTEPLQDGGDAPDDETPQGAVRIKGLPSLERLRDHIRQAARELERLREENRALHERLTALEARPALDPDGTALTFDEDPAKLRARIEGFIEALDAYLAGEATE